ncbi:hypothetical protein BpHYR1_036368 [Brachionus plicatilis]|uniref:Uncharacterized protein n=1 Tax=Brachionus plicatilis TaxID=10195 RepID=A0A3M7QPE0_BRAPC|nr:hypothetical protein BpHYR1_036368 [Brachionus plicatilis]
MVSEEIRLENCNLFDSFSDQDEIEDVVPKNNSRDTGKIYDYHQIHSGQLRMDQSPSFQHNEFDVTHAFLTISIGFKSGEFGRDLTKKKKTNYCKSLTAKIYCSFPT